MRFRTGALVCAASFAIALLPMAGNADENVVVGGSTNPAGAVGAAAKAFMDRNPAIDVSLHPVSSGAGIAALKAGTIDVAMSDVAIDDPTFVDHRIGWLGIAIIAGPDTGISAITRTQLIGIYSGKITNWKQLGGRDQRIVPISRPIGTGTRYLFETLVAKTPIETLAPAKVSEMSTVVGNTPGAIGYVATNVVDPARVTVLEYDGVLPTPQNVRSHRYTFAADEHLYTTKTSSAASKAFAEFVVHDSADLAKFGIY